MSAILISAGILGALLPVACLCLCPGPRRWTEKCATCGHVPPPPTRRAHGWLRFFSRCLVWLQAGKVEVIGFEHLSAAGIRLVVSNHGHYLDPFVLATLLPEPARYMAARGVFRFGFGLGSYIFAPWGAFCADLRAGKGMPALDAAVRVLGSGQLLVMFPEGWAHMDGKVRPFKRGAVHVARKAAAQTGSEVSIVPVCIHYGAHPGTWISRLRPPMQYLVTLLGFALYRRGVRVVIGAPLSPSALPMHPTEAAAALREAVLALESCHPTMARYSWAAPCLKR